MRKIMCVVDGVHNSRREDLRRYLKVCKRLHSWSFLIIISPFLLSFSGCNTSGICKACGSSSSLYNHEITHILPILASSKELWCVDGVLMVCFVFVSGSRFDQSPAGHARLRHSARGCSGFCQWVLWGAQGQCAKTRVAKQKHYQNVSNSLSCSVFISKKKEQCAWPSVWSGCTFEVTNTVW